MKINKHFVILFIIVMIAPFILYPVFVMKVLCFALFACAFNLMLGFLGLLSFGHAAFLGTGGYVTGYLILSFGLPPELGILCGTLAAAALGALYGKLAIKREGIYFAMVTLALAQLAFFFFLQAPFSGGEDGLQGVPRGLLFGFIDLNNNMSLYYFVAAIFGFGFWVIYRTIHSPFGQIMKAIRENEPRAISLGYDVNKYKWVTFIISAGLAGLAGSTKTLVFQLASLTDVHWHMSGEVVLMTLVGGLGTIMGPIVGASVIIGLQNYMAGGVLGNYLHIIMGVIFVVCVLTFRSGIVGAYNGLMERNFKK